MAGKYRKEANITCFAALSSLFTNSRAAGYANARPKARDHQAAPASIHPNTHGSMDTGIKNKVYKKVKNALCPSLPCREGSKW